jgi:Ku protein
MPRAYWKGYLRLSLVNCPIELFPATSQAEKTHFHQINTKTGHRLRQQMVDAETGQVVDSNHKGRGYELSRGQYVPIDDEELDAVEIESTHTVDIEGFVPKADIDKRYLDRPYYIAPAGKMGADAFAVIRDAMADKDRVALAKIVIAHRGHIIALEPLGKGLLGTTLRYDYEVRDEADYFSDIPSPHVGRDMVSLAAHILEAKETKFDPRKFKDEYDIALKKLIRRKAKGKTIEAPPPPEKPDNVINLMDALRQSVSGAGRGARKSAARKSAARKSSAHKSSAHKSATARKRRTRKAA